MRLVNYFSECDARRIFGDDFNNYPSIHVSGSLIGMKKIYGWDLKKVIRVGQYYYHLRGHPYFKDLNR